MTSDSLKQCQDMLSKYYPKRENGWSSLYLSWPSHYAGYYADYGIRHEDHMAVMKWCDEHVGIMQVNWDIIGLNLNDASEDTHRSPLNYYFYEWVHVISFENDSDMILFKLKFPDCIVRPDNILDTHIIYVGP